MKKTTFLRLLLTTFFGLGVVGCQPVTDLPQNEDVVFQYSTLASLSAGVYDGEITYGELKQHGNFGLGTFNALDGEMVEVDGQIYQVKSDGVAYAVEDQMKAPFAVVTYFLPDQTVKVTEPTDCEQLKTFLDSKLPTKNIPYAIKVTGTFAQLQTRSVPRQSKPYPPLADVTKTQPTFDFQGVQGVMLGFRLPPYLAGINATGYHFHFITADRKAGGHVLKCQVRDVTVEIDNTPEWNMTLPDDQAFYQVNLSSNNP